MRYGREMIDLIELAASVDRGLNNINKLTLSILSTLSTLSIDPFVSRARERVDRRNSKLERNDLRFGVERWDEVVSPKFQTGAQRSRKAAPTTSPAPRNRQRNQNRK
jgi:hypothetical protein